MRVDRSLRPSLEKKEFDIFCVAAKLILRIVGMYVRESNIARCSPETPCFSPGSDCWEEGRSQGRSLHSRAESGSTFLLCSLGSTQLGMLAANQ